MHICAHHGCHCGAVRCYVALGLPVKARCGVTPRCRASWLTLAYLVDFTSIVDFLRVAQVSRELADFS